LGKAQQAAGVKLEFSAMSLNPALVTLSSDPIANQPDVVGRSAPIMDHTATSQLFHNFNLITSLFHPRQGLRSTIHFYFTASSKI